MKAGRWLLLALFGAALTTLVLAVPKTARSDTPPEYRQLWGQLADLCANCHTDWNPNFAPKDPQTFESERAWMTRSGKGLGKWVKRPGFHSQDDLKHCLDCHKPEIAYPETGGLSCDFCHLPNGTGHKWTQEFAYPTDPTKGGVNCGQGCHTFLGNVNQAGFPNASGDPEKSSYHGTIQPGELLAGGSTKHTANWTATGCATCHDPTRHGSVPTCVNCHSYSWFNTSSPSSNLHLTHIPFVTAEMPLADPAGFQAQRKACEYCHAFPSGTPSGPPASASCWNCHLSGHNPITPYWEIGTPGVAPSLPPAPGVPPLPTDTPLPSIPPSVGAGLGTS